MHLTILRATHFDRNLSDSRAELIRKRLLDLPKTAVWCDGLSMDCVMLWRPASVEELRRTYQAASSSVALRYAFAPKNENIEALRKVDVDKAVAELHFQIGMRIFQSMEGTLKFVLEQAMRKREHKLLVGHIRVEEVLARVLAPDRARTWGSHLQRIIEYQKFMKALLKEEGNRADTTDGGAGAGDTHADDQAPAQGGGVPPAG